VVQTGGTKSMPQAQAAARVCAFFRIGYCVDFVEARKFFKMAADEGDARGEFNYETALSQYWSSIEDLVTISRYLKRAADQDLASG
jgi:TPR repeat protein